MNAKFFSRSQKFFFLNKNNLKNMDFPESFVEQSKHLFCMYCKTYKISLHVNGYHYIKLTVKVPASIWSPSEEKSTHMNGYHHLKLTVKVPANIWSPSEEKSTAVTGPSCSGKKKNYQYIFIFLPTTVYFLQFYISLCFHFYIFHFIFPYHL